MSFHAVNGTKYKSFCLKREKWHVIIRFACNIRKYVDRTTGEISERKKIGSKQKKKFKMDKVYQLQK